MAEILRLLTVFSVICELRSNIFTYYKVQNAIYVDDGKFEQSMGRELLKNMMKTRMKEFLRTQSAGVKNYIPSPGMENPPPVWGKGTRPTFPPPPTSSSTRPFPIKHWRKTSKTGRLSAMNAKEENCVDIPDTETRCYVRCPKGWHVIKGVTNCLAMKTCCLNKNAV